MDNRIHVSKIDLIKKINRSIILTTAEKDVLIDRLHHMDGSCRGIELLVWMISVEFSSCIEAWEIYHKRTGLFKYIETLLCGNPRWDQWNWGFNSWRLNPSVVITPTLCSLLELIRILQLDRIYTFYLYHAGGVTETTDSSTAFYHDYHVLDLCNIENEPQKFGILLMQK